MYNLFLDDFRDPQEAYDYKADNDYLDLEWIVVRSYSAFVQMIEQKGLPEIISFDHDLTLEFYKGEESYDQLNVKTGYHCAQWLVEFCKSKHLPIPEYKIHTMNPLGEMNIRNVLEDVKN